MMGVSEVAHVCDDHVTIYSPSAHSIESIDIHQPNSIDVVITTPRALGRWSHKENRVRGSAGVRQEEGKSKGISSVGEQQKERQSKGVSSLDEIQHLSYRLLVCTS